MNTHNTTDSTGPVTVRARRIVGPMPYRCRAPLSSYEIAAMVAEILAIEADPSTWRREQAKTAAS